MKIHLRNNKAIAAILAVAIVIGSAGATYAWFTIRSAQSNSTLELGNIEVKAAFTTNLDEALFEPGDLFDIQGIIQNTGNLPFAAKLDINSAVTVFRDANGTPLNGYPEGIPAPADDDYVKIALNPDMIPEDIVEINGELCYYAWLYDKNNPDQYYLFADPQIELDLIFNIEFSEEMGNQYMNARASFVKSMLATQMKEKAILAELGVDVDDLGYLSELQTNTGATTFATDLKHDQIAAWLNEQLGR